MTYGCHNRAPFKPHRGRDGYWCDPAVLWDEDDYIEICGLLADYFANGGAMYS